MLVFFIFMGIIAWLIFAFWPAWVAQRKGYSFWLFFLISLPFFFITLFVVYLMPSKNPLPYDEIEEKE